MGGTTMTEPAIAVRCDRCGRLLLHDCGHPACFPDPRTAEREAVLSFDWTRMGGKLYCNECYYYDDKQHKIVTKNND